MVDLNALDFEGKKIHATPLDEVRTEDIKDRTKDLFQ
jgi:hypothetical protein